MKKVAVFVEGQTELLFVENYLKEIFTRAHIAITS